MSSFMVNLWTNNHFCYDLLLKDSNIIHLYLGRGTTTFDGCAIAHAVAKFLTKKQCRTIFSTHYHELMREFMKRSDMKVYHMSVMEDEEDVVFMYTVAPGPCSKSHGFNAAKMAGLSEEIIEAGLKTAERFEANQVNLLKMADVFATAAN